MKQFNTVQKVILSILLIIPFFSNAQNYCNSNPVSIHGDLSVNGHKIVNQNNEAVSFAGNSLFWSNTGWGGERYYTSDVVSWLEQDWGSTIVRAAMGVEDNGGYISNPTSNKNRVKTLVDAAIANDMYVIIDWHSHHAEEHQAEAIAFFQEMAQTYGSYPNIIYEIYNEPLQVSWSNTIKPYAEAVIGAIRAIDPDNLIVVGTPTWSQDVDVASYDPIVGYSNIVYTLHFYAGTHTASLRQKAQTAMNNGIAIMVTEWGTVNANGDGGVAHESTDEWMSFLEANDISHLNWSINDKSEGASALTPGSSTSGGWSANNLTASGTKVKNIISNWGQYCSDGNIDTPPIDITDTPNNDITLAYPNGVPHSIPGIINATHYDTGGAGVSYKDSSAGNSGNGPRQTEDIDTEYRTATGNVGWINAGEWLEFTVDVQTEGNYTIDYQVASKSSGQFRLEFDGQDLTGTVDAVTTGGWGNFTTVNSQNVALNSGQQTMRLHFTKGPFNIADITFELAETSPPSTVDVTGISVNPTTLTLDEGDIATISASVAPNDATNSTVIWSSDNTTVATVDNSGTVTALNEGGATITATTIDGGYTANTAVTVNSINIGNEGGENATCDNPISVSLPFSHDGAGSYCWEIIGTINYINSWAATSITINGMDYTNTWSNNMPEQIDGKYYVQFESNIAWGHFEVSGVSLKLDTGTQSEISIYPNPSNGNFKIEHQIFSEQAVVEIYNNYGQIVYKQEGISSAGDLNLGKPLQPGLYFITVTDGELSMTKKLIIK